MDVLKEKKKKWREGVREEGGGEAVREKQGDEDVGGDDVERRWRGCALKKCWYTPSLRKILWNETEKGGLGEGWVRKKALISFNVLGVGESTWRAKV